MYYNNAFSDTMQAGMMKFVKPGNAMSRYITCDNLIRKLAQKGFKSEAALINFLLG